MKAKQFEKYCKIVYKNAGVESQIRFKKYQKEQFYRCLNKVKDIGRK